jgi:hypothetical protein
MTDAWWLKLKRAQYHMVEIDREARRYAKVNAHVVERVPNSNSKPNRWIYKLRIVEQPDPMVSVIFGEFVHNLRSALDNLVVASVPRSRQKSASFPVLFEDIWATDADGGFIVKDDERRKSFETATKGLDPLFIDAIKVLQPYQHRPEEWDTHVLGILSRLENADKHRRLIALGSGLRDATARITVKGNSKTYTLAKGIRQTVDDGAIVAQFDYIGRGPLNESEVEVEVSGTPVISVRIAGLDGNAPVPDYRLRSCLWKPLTDVRFVIRGCERFVRPESRLEPVQKLPPRTMMAAPKFE